MSCKRMYCRLCIESHPHECVFRKDLVVPFASRLRALPTETKVESGTSQSKCGKSVNLRNRVFRRNCRERGVVVTEAGSYLRRIDSCITQLKAQGPSRACNESKGVAFGMVMQASYISSSSSSLLSLQVLDGP